jgi:hypothetical protein
MGVIIAPINIIPDIDEKQWQTQQQNQQNLKKVIKVWEGFNSAYQTGMNN